MSFIVFSWAVCFSSFPALAAVDAAHQDIPLLEQWTSDYPVAKLDLLPAGQRHASTGFISDINDFDLIWEAFKSGEPTPSVDFNQNVIIFLRNVDFYNKTKIFKVQLSDGLAQVMAMETMSAMPVEDRVAMAMVVVPRAGMTAILAGEEEIPLPRQTGTTKANHLGSSPLNTFYILEGQTVQLVDGHAAEQAAPGSATVTRTSVVGQPVYGELDNDMPAEAAVLLVHMPGGSGTFYYVASAKKINESWQGSNAVLIGDRISSQTIEIRDKILIVNYADRRMGDSMSTPPSVEKEKHLTLSDGRLTEVSSRQE